MLSIHNYTKYIFKFLSLYKNDIKKDYKTRRSFGITTLSPSPLRRRSCPCKMKLVVKTFL